MKTNDMEKKLVREAVLLAETLATKLTERFEYLLTEGDTNLEVMYLVAGHAKANVGEYIKKAAMDACEAWNKFQELDKLQCDMK